MKFGPYEIQSPLGAGGMGELYRAGDTKLGRDVALILAMKWVSSLLLALLIVCSVPAAAQEPAKQTSPANAAAVKEGASLFRANCSPCHGLNAQGGGRGPDLTSGRWTHGSTDDEIFRTISQGVPGTEMPANGLEESEIRAIIAYLRSLASPKRITVAGDAVKGKKIFFSDVGCSSCHMVLGVGGVLGPDLSRVGAARSISYLIDSIRNPDKELSSGMIDPNNHYGLPLVYDTVTVVTTSGEKITGVARNEDTYSIQMITTAQQLRLFLKKDLKEVSHQRRSLMPPYSEDALDRGQLQDLIAYLVTLRGIDDKEGR
jgi:putative heme-binding domain-containing protein